MDRTTDFSVNNVLIQAGIVTRDSSTHQLKVGSDVTVAKVKKFEAAYGQIPMEIRGAIMTEIATRYEKKLRETALANYCNAKTSIIKVRKVNKFIFDMCGWRILEPIDKKGNLHIGPVSEARQFRFIASMVNGHDFFNLTPAMHRYVEENHLTQKQFDELYVHITALNMITKEYVA